MKNMDELIRQAPIEYQVALNEEKQGPIKEFMKPPRR